MNVTRRLMGGLRLARRVTAPCQKFVCRGFSSEENNSFPADATVAASLQKPGQGTWAWVPPKRTHTGTEVRGDKDVIPVKMDTLLSRDEVEQALTSMGGIDVVSVPLKNKMMNIKEFTIVSGTSIRHIRKMSDAVVRALKSRNIHKAMGFTGAEGAKDDDWLLIDCYDRIVHIMLPHTRDQLNMEEHWGGADSMPVAPPIKPSSDEYDFYMEQLLDKYPAPEEWGQELDEDQDTVKEKGRKKTKDDKRDVIFF